MSILRYKKYKVKTKEYRYYILVYSGILFFSKIQLVVYYQCCPLIG